MSVITYQELALDWQPSERSSREFQRIVTIVLVLALIFMIVLTFVKVPDQPRHERTVVPDRIADFIAHKDKPIVEPPKPIVEPIVKPIPKPPEEKKPEPVPEPVPTNEPLREKIEARKNERKPLTDSEQAARKVAEKSGLLALSNELNDLVDTKNINATVGRNLSTTASSGGVDQSTVAAGHDVSAITAGVAQSGGVVNQSQYETKVSKTELTERKVEKVAATDPEKSAAGKTRTIGAEEDVTIVFDKNKSGLYSLYDRARRSTPDLQGKIVFQLTISATGDVIDVKILSSDLHNPELEERLLSRIKAFKFKGNGTKPTTITYPIEFLPS